MPTAPAPVKPEGAAEVVPKAPDMPMPEAPPAPKILHLNVNAPLFDPTKMPAFVPTVEGEGDAKKKSKSARKKSRAKAAAAAVQEQTTGGPSVQPSAQQKQSVTPK